MLTMKKNYVNNIYLLICWTGIKSRLAGNTLEMTDTDCGWTDIRRVINRRTDVASSKSSLTRYYRGVTDKLRYRGLIASCQNKS